jgi:hypothetical protein
VKTAGKENKTNETYAQKCRQTFLCLGFFQPMAVSLQAELEALRRHFWHAQSHSALACSNCFAVWHPKIEDFEDVKALAALNVLKRGQ